MHVAVFLKGGNDAAEGNDPDVVGQLLESDGVLPVVGKPLFKSTAAVPYRHILAAAPGGGIRRVGKAVLV